MKLSYFSQKRKGLSLVELLVVIFIFGVIIVIISTSLVQGFMTGRLHSSATKDINRELNAATALIAQKMTNANAKYTTAPFTTTNIIYGFAVLPNNVLAIASQSTPNDQCTFFQLKTSDQALYMNQGNCNSFILSVPNINAVPNPVPATGWSKITTGITKITSFDLSNNYNYVATSNIAPWVTVKITGEDTSRTKAKVTLEQTYSLNYPYEKNW